LAVWSEAERPAYLCCSFDPTRSCRASRKLHPGTASDEGRSRSCIAIRIKASPCEERKYGYSLSGHPLCTANADQEPGLRCCLRTHARPRNRGEHSDFYRCKRSPAENASYQVSTRARACRRSRNGRRQVERNAIDRLLFPSAISRISRQQYGL